MEYNEALAYIYNKSDSKFIIESPFLMFSYLSDLTKGSYQGTKLANIFYELNKEVNVIQMIEREGIDNSLTNLIPYYKEFRQKVDVIDFKLCVRGMVEIFDSKYFEGKPVKGEERKKIVITNNHQTQLASNQGAKPAAKKPQANNHKKVNKQPNANQTFNAQAAQNFLNIVYGAKQNQQQAVLKPSLPLNKAIPFDLKGIEVIEIYSKCASVSLSQDGSNCMILQDIKGTCAQSVLFESSSRVNNKTLCIDVSNQLNKKVMSPLTLIFHCDMTKLKKVLIYSNKPVSFMGNCNEIQIESEKEINCIGNTECIYLRSSTKARYTGNAKIGTIKSFKGSVRVCGNCNELTLTSNPGDIYYLGNANRLICKYKTGHLRVHVGLFTSTVKCYQLGGFNVKEYIRKHR